MIIYPSIKGKNVQDLLFRDDVGRKKSVEKP